MCLIEDAIYFLFLFQNQLKQNLYPAVTRYLDALLQFAQYFFLNLACINASNVISEGLASRGGRGGGRCHK